MVEEEDEVRMGGVREIKQRGYKVKEEDQGVEEMEIMEEMGGEVDIVV